MARNKKQARRPAPRPASATGARRLGAENNRQQLSSGAQRRSQRRRSSQSRTVGWLSVGAVILVVVVLVVVKLTSGSTPSSSSSSGVSSGRDAPAAPAALVKILATVPASTFDAVGTDGLPAPFTATKGQVELSAMGHPELLYYGALFCPYCALMRWSLVVALSRFGTFRGLKETSSASTDGDVPTFSFLGSTYTSKYLTFAPYEAADRNQDALQPVPKSVTALFTKYDGSESGTPAPGFNAGGEVGIPFMDVANRYVSSGDPGSLGSLYDANGGNGVLVGGGPGTYAIAQAIASPDTSVAKAISASYFVAEANYLSAAICGVDGGQPAAVCASPGVKAAAKALSALKPVS